MSAKFYVRLAGPLRAMFACLGLLCLCLTPPQASEFLVDTGSGELLDPKLNKLPVSLKAVGVSPEARWPGRSITQRQCT
jgi:hypothetical protein